MRPNPIPPQTTPATTPRILPNNVATHAPASARVQYLTNAEAAAFLRLSPRTMEKQRVLGGGPRFHKFGRRVLYAIDDLEAWANARSFEMTSDPEYVALR